jgi:hypothetical protein
MFFNGIDLSVETRAHVKPSAYVGDQVVSVIIQSTKVRIVQKWNGVRPSIKPLLYEFYIHIADAKLMEIQGIKVKQPVAIRKYYNYWKSTND